MVTIHKYNYIVFMITCKIVFSLLFCLQYNVQRYMFVYVCIRHGMIIVIVIDSQVIVLVIIIYNLNVDVIVIVIYFKWYVHL